ncbi:hypothetical protein ACA910_006673 [Epithemia clementina (nom. ined.)]
MDDNYRYLRLSVPLSSPTSSPLNPDDDFNNHINRKILIVALDRPRKHNALNARMWKEIGTLFSLIGVAPQYTPCRCVLLVGNGPSFCAGIDVRDASFFTPFVDDGSGSEANNNNNDDNDDDDNKEMDAARAGLAFASKLQEMQQAFSAIESCPVPVVAAVHGNVVGGAIDLITATQIRLCTADSRFAVKEVAVGLAADVGTLQRLPKLVGNQSLVHELCYTGRNFSAETALQIGLVSRVIDGRGHPENGDSHPGPVSSSVAASAAARAKLYQEALQLCQEIAQHSPLAVHGTKRALLYSRDHSVAQGLDQIASYNQLALQAPDAQTAIMAAATATTPNGGSKPRFDDIPPRCRL